MKHIAKNVSVLAFILAVVCSLAFNTSNSETISTGYIQYLYGPNFVQCQAVRVYMCGHSGPYICTYLTHDNFLGPVNAQVYEIDNGTMCSTILYAQYPGSQDYEYVPYVNY